MQPRKCRNTRSGSGDGVGSGLGRAREGQFLAFARGVHSKPGIELSGQGSGLIENHFELIVRAIRVMVEEKEMFDPRFGGLTNHGVDATMTPADA